MKKLLISILAVFMASIFAVFGTGCMPETILTFYNNFAGGKSPSELPNNYSELLVYDVSNVDNYESITNTGTIKHKVPKYTGTFTSHLVDSVPSHVDLSLSDIQNNQDFNDSKIYYLKTVLDLQIEFDDKSVNNDMIISEVCFYQSNLSFAPIWSKSTTKMTSLNLTTEQMTSEQNIYQYQTIYNSTSYSLTKKFYQKDANENVNDIDISNNQNLAQDKLKVFELNGNKTYEYTLKTLIDNNQLLFALRNIKFTESVTNYTLPTVSYTYGQSKTINVSNDSQETVNLKYDLTNGTELSNQNLSMPVIKLSFVLTGSDYVGTKKIVKVQREQTDNYAYNAIPIEYAEPLIDRAMSTYGALKYTIKQVDIKQ